MKGIIRTLFVALLCFNLAACASGKKSKKASKPKPTPAERLAVKHYKLGIDSYTNSKYAEAIKHWKITLEKDPKNPNAAQYIERAQNMINVLKKKK